MVHVTRNFSQDSPLSPRARELLLDAFDQGWADPRKLSQSASRAQVLENQAIESISSALGVAPSEVEVLGEPALGHYLAIQGLLPAQSTLIHSSVDKQEILAIARTVASAHCLSVTGNGQIEKAAVRQIAHEGVLALQGANGETGVVQEVGALINEVNPNCAIYLDFTSAGNALSLPDRWDCALYDSRAWSGPAGLGLLLIKSGSRWRNPLPHLNSRKTTRSFSLPLLLVSAVALDEWQSQRATSQPRQRALTKRLRDGLTSAISNCDVAGDVESSLPHLTSCSFLFCEAEELLRELEKVGFLVDSGSACTSDDLQPSHVLAAMGILTHGNIRITVRADHSEADIDALVQAIVVTVQNQRKA